MSKTKTLRLRPALGAAFAGGVLALAAAPASAEGDYSAQPGTKWTPQSQQRVLEARTEQRARGQGELSAWAKGFFFQFNEPGDQDAADRMGDKAIGTSGKWN